MNSKMIKVVRIDSLSPAGYNPRKLADDAQENLKKSLSTLGIIKAIVIRGNDGRILAGHQRTKTMKLLGIKECPAFCLENVSEYDEVRFNQLHNFTEVEITDNQPLLRVNVPKGTVGFVEVQPKDIKMVNKGGEASKVVMLTELISKYGQFANAVADSSGNIIISSVYAKTIKLLRKPLLVYVLPEGLDKDAEYYFSKQYGEFNYDHIKRNTYIQSEAQILRNPEEQVEKIYKSTLYETRVLPYIQGKKELRILDFGAGFKGYYKMLKGQGYKIDAIEFFYVEQQGREKIFTEQVERDCKEICSHIKEHGLYDVVICDSVLNSVDSIQAEKSVLRTLSALCKDGGTIFWSGIPIHGIKKRGQVENSAVARSRGVFLDQDNFTANFRSGVWYFQHYHDMQSVIRCQRENISNSFRVFDAGHERNFDDELKSGSFQVWAQNYRVVPKEELLEAVRFEFTLPLPGNKRYELDKYIIPILEEVL